MARRLIDISVPLQNDVPADPPGGHPTIQYIDHQQGLPRMLQFFDNQEIIAAHLYPTLTTMELPHYQMGQWAVEELLHLMAHSDSDMKQPLQYKMECPLIRRDSA